MVVISPKRKKLNVSPGHETRGVSGSPPGQSLCSASATSRRRKREDGGGLDLMLKEEDREKVQADCSRASEVESPFLQDSGMTSGLCLAARKVLMGVCVFYSQIIHARVDDVWFAFHSCAQVLVTNTSFGQSSRTLPSARGSHLFSHHQRSTPLCRCQPHSPIYVYMCT